MKNYLRTLGYVEGVSLLMLLFIAMPIKYIGGEPIVVRWVGMIHGLLFVAYCFCAITYGTEKNWSKKRLFFALILATIPFGPFVFDKKVYQDN